MNKARESAQNGETWFTASGIGPSIEAAKANTLQIIDAMVPEDTHEIVYIAWREAAPLDSVDVSADDVPQSRMVLVWEIGVRVCYQPKEKKP